MTHSYVALRIAKGMAHPRRIPLPVQRSICSFIAQRFRTVVFTVVKRFLAELHTFKKVSFMAPLARLALCQHII